MNDTEHVKQILRQALTKLKDAIEAGPDGPDVVMTPEEATVLGRVVATFLRSDI